MSTVAAGAAAGAGLVTVPEGVDGADVLQVRSDAAVPAGADRIGETRHAEHDEIADLLGHTRPIGDGADAGGAGAIPRFGAGLEAPGRAVQEHSAVNRGDRKGGAGDGHHHLASGAGGGVVDRHGGRAGASLDLDPACGALGLGLGERLLSRNQQHRRRGSEH